MATLMQHGKRHPVKPRLEALESRLAPADYYWTGAVNGDFHHWGNWTLGPGGAVPDAGPGAADYCVIDAGYASTPVVRQDTLVGGLNMDFGTHMQLEDDFTVRCPETPLGLTRIGDVRWNGSWSGEITLCLWDFPAGSPAVLAGRLWSEAEGEEKVLLYNAHAASQGLTLDGIKTFDIGGNDENGWSSFTVTTFADVTFENTFAEVTEFWVRGSGTLFFEARSGGDGGNLVRGAAGTLRAGIHVEDGGLALVKGGASAWTDVDAWWEVAGLLELEAGAWMRAVGQGGGLVRVFNPGEVHMRDGSRLHLADGSQLRLESAGGLHAVMAQAGGAARVTGGTVEVKGFGYFRFEGQPGLLEIDILVATGDGVMHMRGYSDGCDQLHVKAAMNVGVQGLMIGLTPVGAEPGNTYNWILVEWEPPIDPPDPATAFDPTYVTGYDEEDYELWRGVNALILTLDT